MYTHVLSKPARTLGARSAAKTGGTSSSLFSPAATKFSPSTEFTIVSKQHKTNADKLATDRQLNGNGKE
jgi:hypothetical protein